MIEKLYKHLKSGHLYKVIGESNEESTGRRLVHYVDVDQPGSLPWTRPREEFYDGRFTLAGRPMPDPQAQDAASPATVTYITVRSQFIAFHRWRDCPHEEVAFLRDFHRHVFHVKLSLRVSHSDRDVEFFIVQKQLQAALAEWEGGLHEFSCEKFAELLLQRFAKQGYAVHSVRVSEDDENSATVLMV